MDDTGQSKLSPLGAGRLQRVFASTSQKRLLEAGSLYSTRSSRTSLRHVLPQSRARTQFSRVALSETTSTSYHGLDKPARLFPHDGNRKRRNAERVPLLLPSKDDHVRPPPSREPKDQERSKTGHFVCYRVSTHTKVTCNKIFVRKADLKRHQQVIHDKHIIERFKCPFEGCARGQLAPGIPGKDNLRRHIKDHHGKVLPESQHSGHGGHPTPTEHGRMKGPMQYSPQEPDKTVLHTKQRSRHHYTIAEDQTARCNGIIINLRRVLGKEAAPRCLKKWRRPMQLVLKDPPRYLQSILQEQQRRKP